MILLRLLLIYSVVAPIINLLWINSLFFEIEMLVKVVKTFSISLTLVSIFLALQSILKSRFTGYKWVTIIVLLLFFYNIFASIIGFLNGYGAKVIPDFFTAVNGPLIAYALIVSDLNLDKIKQFLSRFSILFVVSFTICLSIMLVEAYIGIPHYPAMASGWLVLPIGILISKKKYFQFFLIFLLVVMSGKRSILLMFILSLPIYLIMKKGLNFYLSFFGSLFLSIPILVGSLGLFKILEESDLKFGRSVINKIALVNPFSERFNFELAAGERVEEVFQSLEANNDNSLSTWIGSGNGFVYELRVDRKNFIEKERHNVHFSPISYFTRYGLIFTILFYGTFIYYLNWIGDYIGKYSAYLNGMILYQLFGFLATFVSFSLSTDYLFWTCLGLSMNLVQQIREKSIT